MPPEIQNNPRFFPWFEDFIGAIDGTHVRASVPIEMQERFRGRKDKTTQNVLAAVDFDLKFTYVLAGWEGSAHDSRVLGKYYLADAGYGDRKGFMSLFRRVRYHLKEYTDNPPENEQELFNLRHSSLRMCIERAYRVLKKRFCVLDAEPFWSYETQVDVVLACFVIYNYLRGVDPNDAITREADLEVETHDIRKSLTRKEIREETKECVKKRNSIGSAMWNAYKKHRTN
ncbi:protein ALP1-like [Chenopodium quinoa]|uniref:protein ALP1-like n=1 Tax=Chenopodium quinoa TaxID=63459 RepID=UPI000B7765B3|nr:protein ALP1-like [Chenopodium quinoa]